MVAGILLVAASQVWLAEVGPGSSYLATILPASLVRGAGLGLAVTPLTAAVLAAVGDADLGEASAINDAASRVGGVIAIALVPLLIGVERRRQPRRLAVARLRARDARDRRALRRGGARQLALRLRRARGRAARGAATARRTTAAPYPPATRR